MFCTCGCTYIYGGIALARAVVNGTITGRTHVQMHARPSPGRRLAPGQLASGSTSSSEHLELEQESGHINSTLSCDPCTGFLKCSVMVKNAASDEYE